jgi:hypothetical protein
LDLAENNVVYFIQPEAQNKTNISIDKVVISQVLDQFYELKITLQAFGETENEVPLSVFSNNKAIAKTIAKFDNPKDRNCNHHSKKRFSRQHQHRRQQLKLRQRLLSKHFKT